MVLKQKRENTDVLIVDASKGFIKEGKNNKLRASDIKKIADAVTKRETIPKYSRAVSREEIRSNDYNLNIPRYVDSSESTESWDIYASMFGGIPKTEIDALGEYWLAFPNLRESLFGNSDNPYSELMTEDVKAAIKEHSDVVGYEDSFKTAFASFYEYLKAELIDKMDSLVITQQESVLSEEIFKRLCNIPLIDKYVAYQLLDDEWSRIAVDLEIIQSEGFEATKKVDPNLIIKKKDGKEEEVQEGRLGHIIPFELVQESLLKDKYIAVNNKEKRLAEIASEYETIIDTLSEDDKNSQLLNNTNDAFVAKEVEKRVKRIFEDIELEEINILNEYMMVGKAKKAQMEFVKEHNNVHWENIPTNSNGTYNKKDVTAYIDRLRLSYTFDDGSFEASMLKVNKLIAEEKELKKQLKIETAELHILTKETIEALSDEQVYTLLEKKWIESLVNNLNKLPDSVVDSLVSKLQALQTKYATTYFDIEKEIKETEEQLCSMIDDLVGNEFDMKGLSEFKALLMGD
jgi:type I restriction enzyme M protein